VCKLNFIDTHTHLSGTRLDEDKQNLSLPSHLFKAGKLVRGKEGHGGKFLSTLLLGSKKNKK